MKRFLLIPLSVCVLLLVYGSSLSGTIPLSSSSSNLLISQRIHKDLVIRKTRILEDKTLRISGNIIVNNAKLIIKNSTIKFIQLYKDQYNLQLHGNNAALIIKNSEIKTTHPGKQTSLVVLDNSRVQIRNSLIDISIVAHGGEHSKILIKSSNVHEVLRGSPYTRIRIIDSKLESQMVLGFYGETHEHITLTDLKPGAIEKFSFHTVEGGGILLKNTYVGGWVLFFRSMDKVGTKKHVILKNSELNWIWLEFPPGSDLRIKDLKSWTHYSELTLSEKVKGQGLEYNLAIKNSYIDTWKLMMRGGIQGSRFDVKNYSGQIAPFNKANVTVKNSYVKDYVVRGGGAHVKFVNSTIVAGWLLDSKVELRRGLKAESTTIFKNSTVRAGRIEVVAESCVIKGDVSLSVSLSHVNWHSGKILREYLVVLRNGKGKPIPDAPLKLINPYGHIISRKETNKEGTAYFIISFTKQNYKKSWTLEAKVRDRKVSKKIKFTSNTPIVYSLEQLRKRIGNKISFVEYLMDWAKRLGKKANFAKAESEIKLAKKKFEVANYDKALKLVNHAKKLLGIEIDGKSGDWKGIKPIAVDPNEDEIRDNADIKAVYTIKDKKYLYVMLEVYGDNVDSSSIFFDFNVDKDEQKDFGVHGSDARLTELPPYEKYREIYSVDKASATALELKIPLDYLGYPKNIVLTVQAQIPVARGTVVDKVEPKIAPAPLSTHPTQNKVKKSLTNAKYLINWAKKYRQKEKIKKARNFFTRAQEWYSQGKFEKAFTLSKRILKLIGIKIDGYSNEWEEIGFTALDPRGDAVIEKGDIKSLSAFMDQQFLYLMVETYNEKPVYPMLFFMIDINSDGWPDYLVDAFGTQIRQRTRLRVVHGTKKKPSIEIKSVFKYPIKTVYGKVVELKVPLDYLGYPKSFNLMLNTASRKVNPIDHINGGLIQMVE